MMPQTDSIESIDAFVCPHCGHEYWDDYYLDGKHWIQCEKCGEDFYMYKRTSSTFRTEKIYI